MKKTLTAASIALVAATSMANAGGMAEPVMTMEPEMIEIAPQDDRSAIIIPLIMVALVALAMSSSGSAPATIIAE